MAGLLLKLIICPLVVIFADRVLSEVYFFNIYQAIVTGVLLALTGHLMEIIFLRRGRLWENNVLDFIFASLIVYFVGQLLPGAYVNVFGALVTGWLLAVTEHFQHRWLLRTGRTQKELA
ncbi:MULTISPECIES: DUF2512 family protein [Thermoactinomyces]|jgi:uncharacterized membrane protein YfcA|uniref:DUF2512 family protein n=1 Tax=Thermoactinomyces daqus TaxID=1329516 RepID=A0A7W1XA39_9BACL|nr:MULTISPECIES: DUF2512 family protein [Thermoactinomyces]MBA4542839.1 DUF2512 family protein [Thermoactinomyces daqus]MBH8598488.1 DUF2512 family protein [Thermoactinomyces sp. CICC 10523]MBH8604667.1 DUF2512 family protein [Thermoactinomyces sp. CICC 10522]MBH8606872.1 DUF2512 family protein [Thermoactinomyces sp. CICC 10521]